jgi:hypothetical protein
MIVYVFCKEEVNDRGKGGASGDLFGKWVDPGSVTTVPADPKVDLESLVCVSCGGVFPFNHRGERLKF